MPELTIRSPRPADLPALTALYNHYVVETPITFDLAPFSVDERAEWLERYGETGRYRLLVAERDGRIVGYAGSHSFRVKAAYDTSVETTIYLDPEATGEGLGTALYTALFDALRGEDIHMALAGITLPNDASVALHRRFGFTDVGIFKAVGRKFDRYWDVLWLERLLV